MFSGLALLMDVHRPDTPNGYGVIFVAGSAWSAPLAYGAGGLKEAQIGDWAPSLLRAGYTVFALNHRGTPRFHFPEPVEDVQRAVRFVRHNAKEFGINPGRLGASWRIVRWSSCRPRRHAGRRRSSRRPRSGQSAACETLQCVVLRAAPSDLKTMIGSSGIGTAAVVAFVNRLPTPNADDQRVYRAASPIAHVSATSPPTLLLHGTQTIPCPISNP